MPPKSQLLLGIEIALAACFGVAAVSGGVSVRPTGLAIEKLADDQIGGAVLIAAFGSCVVASLSLAELLKFRRHADASIFAFAFVIALIAISPMTNVPSSFSMNGASPTIVTYPLFLWLALLIVILLSRFKVSFQAVDGRSSVLDDTSVDELSVLALLLQRGDKCIDHLIGRLQTLSPARQTVVRRYLDRVKKHD